MVVIGRAQKAEAVGQDLEHALAVYETALLGLGAEDGEDELLLAHVRGALDAEALRDLRQLADLLRLEHLEIEGLIACRRFVLGLDLGGRQIRPRRGGFGVEAISVDAFPTLNAAVDGRGAGWPVPPDGLVGHRSVLFSVGFRVYVGRRRPDVSGASA